MGWPRAHAPPWTFSLPWGMSSSLMAAIATTAKASFTSNKSTSSTRHAAFSSAFLTAPTGAVVNQPGSCAWVACSRMTAMGVNPRASASACPASARAAAPSEMELELAAVTLPSLANAGRNFGTFSASPRPGCSSVSTTRSPLREWIKTGAISSLNFPSLMAICARVSESMA